MDHRLIFTADARFAAADPAHPRRLSGYALVWGVPSSDRGGYMVRLAKGSARFATPTLGLYRHDRGQVLANTANATLKLTSDDVGVKFEMDVANTTAGNDTLVLVREKFVAGMSFAMADAPSGKTTRENGVEIFDATDYLVDEISVLVDPAFVQTRVNAFAKHRAHASRELERLRFASLTLDGAYR